MPREREFSTNVDSTPTGAITGYYDWCITTGTRPLLYRELGKILGVAEKKVYQTVRKVGLQQELATLRQEHAHTTPNDADLQVAHALTRLEHALFPEERASRRLPGKKDPYAGAVVGYYDWCITSKQQPMTYDNLGKILGINKKRVYQIVREQGLQEELDAVRDETDWHTTVAWRKADSQQNRVRAIMERALAAGEKPPTYTEIKRKYGIERSVVSKVVNTNPALKADLNELRARRRTEAGEIFYPSAHTAWFLGVLFGPKGRVIHGSEELTLHGTYEVLEEFKTIGMQLLEKPTGEPVDAYQGVSKSGTPYVRFYNREAVNAIRDFTRKNRAETIRSNHAWVLEAPYNGHFLSGIVDSGKHLFPQRAIFPTPFEETADLLNSLLTSLSIQFTISPHGNYYYVTVGKEGLATFAEVVSLQDPQKYEHVQKWKRRQNDRPVTQSKDVFIRRAT